MTTTKQTLRRRRGRQIRKARRVRAAMPQELRPALDWVDRIWARIRAAAAAAWNFLRALVARATPLLLTPRDGVGARRQLLDHGRAPRGRR